MLVSTVLRKSMARLEYIRYEFFVGSSTDRGELVWQSEATRKSINGLPQIFWRNGGAWDEANLWALDGAASSFVALETSSRKMKHLCKFANFLEDRGIDWRHFPVRKEDQVLRQFRGHLIGELHTGSIAGSTASGCMNAVIQFYRFADTHDLVGVHQPMWSDHREKKWYCNTEGFKRSMLRTSTDLRIPNRMRVGPRLEDGLLPIRGDHQTELLKFTSRHEIEELHLMLGTGFLTGARVGTIATLTRSSLETAREDPLTPGLHLLPVGPGTGVATKFSVSGHLHFPKSVLDDLVAYADSATRLLREGKAHHSHKDLLFLTRNGLPYTVGSVNRLVYEMRSRAVSSGLQFMHRFRFHQSRATFGTSLMQLLLDSGFRPTDAIEYVMEAMLHKDEKTTWTYIKFLENTRAKATVAAAFNEAFTGLRSRNWDSVNA